MTGKQKPFSKCLHFHIAHSLADFPPQVSSNFSPWPSSGSSQRFPPLPQDIRTCCFCSTHTYLVRAHGSFGFRVCFPWWHPIIDSLYTSVVLGLLFLRALNQLEVNVRDCLINVWHPNYNKSSRRATSKSTLVLHIPRTHYHIWLRSMPVSWTFQTAPLSHHFSWPCWLSPRLSWRLWQ